MSATLALNSSVSSLALSAIGFYQRRLSRHKGFRCAHHAILGQGSCSHYGRQAFTQHPPLEAYRLVRTRLKECRDVFLSSRSEEENERRKRRDNAIGDGLKTVGDSCDLLSGCGDIGPCDFGS